MRHIILISGKDSLATAIVQKVIQPNFEYEYIFNDTKAELPDTYQWLDKCEQKLGIKILRIGESLEDLITKYNGFLPSGNARYCTRETKIIKLEEYLKNDPCNIYYGLRFDERERVGYIPVKGSNITPKYPLIDLRIDLQGVYSIIEKHGLKPPNFFWPKLYNAVAPLFNKEYPEWKEQIGQWRFDHIFAGRTRSNCYFCFWQRKSEWLWLYETYPDLFKKAQAFEKSNYSWIKDFPLSRFDDIKERRIIFEKTRRKTRDLLLKLLKLKQYEHVENEIVLTSCGLLWGK